MRRRNSLQVDHLHFRSPTLNYPTRLTYFFRSPAGEDIWVIFLYAYEVWPFSFDDSESTGEDFITLENLEFCNRSEYLYETTIQPFSARIPISASFAVDSKEWNSPALPASICSFSLYPNTYMYVSKDPILEQKLMHERKQRTSREYHISSHLIESEECSICMKREGYSKAKLEMLQKSESLQKWRKK